MTKQEFQELTQNVVLLDGATGSNPVSYTHLRAHETPD